MKRFLTWSAALAVAAALMVGASTAIARSAAQSTPTKAFSVKGIALHFRYPTTLQLGTVAGAQTQIGSSAQKEAALVINKANLIAVLAFTKLKIAITSKNVKAVAPQFNAVLSQGFGHKVTGTTSTVHGIPLISYTPQLTKVPGGKGYDKVYYAFDSKTVYELLCQWTKGANQAKVQAACNTMISTLSK